MKWKEEGDDSKQRIAINHEALQAILSVHDDLVTRHTGGETYVVPVFGNLLKRARMFVLNRLGEFVWNQIDGRTTLGEISDRMVETFDVKRAEAEEHVLEFTEQLLDAGLVTKTTP